MKFFWPYLSNKNQSIIKDREARDESCTYRTPFHFVAYHGLSDVADFMLEELQQDSEIEYLKKVKTTACDLNLVRMSSLAGSLRRVKRIKID